MFLCVGPAGPGGLGVPVVPAEAVKWVVFLWFGDGTGRAQGRDGSGRGGQEMNATRKKQATCVACCLETVC